MEVFMSKKVFVSFLIILVVQLAVGGHNRKRARDCGIEIGILKPGKWNAITDVKGVKVGHKTIIEGDTIRTGVTVGRELGRFYKPRGMREKSARIRGGSCMIIIATDRSTGTSVWIPMTKTKLTVLFIPGENYSGFFTG